MASGPSSTVWPLEEHTRGKHLILRHYLNAWIPILGRERDLIVFIDAFAGPGIYAGGEPGSPVIALRAIKEHAAKERITAKLVLVFIEVDPKRYARLQEEISRESTDLPSSVQIESACGRFDAEIGELLQDMDDKALQLAPTFMMVDPFGISDTPMAILAKFLKHPSTEVLVTFMVDFIDRFDQTREFPPHLDELYGCEEWRAAGDLPTKESRRQHLFDLYERQLRRNGAKQVLRLDLWDGQRLIYGLFHASQHVRACEKMKEAIWRACPGGDFAFRGSRGGQLGFQLGADFTPLPGQVAVFLSAKGWVSIEAIQEWIASDETLFCSSHLRKHGLQPLEEAGRLEVDVQPKRRGITYPEGKTRIRLKP